MKQRMRNGILPLFALLILMIVEGINVLGMISPLQWNKFEIMSNFCMFVTVVIGFFWLGLPYKTVGERNVGNILGNVAGSGIAFVMNVTVFGHTIRLEQFLDSLWGWPLGWIVMAVIQILLLSELGKKMLDLICAVLTWCVSIVKMLRALGSDILGIIRNNKSIFRITFVGFVIWGVYFGLQIYVRGVAAVFSDTDIFYRSMLLWVTYSIVCVLVYVVFRSLKKAEETIQNIDGKKVLVVMVAIVLVVIVSVMSSALKIIAISILTPLIGMSLLWLVFRKIDKVGQNTGGCHHQGNDLASINFKDLIIVIISFVGLPLAVICFATAVRIYNEQGIITKDADKISILLDFINVAGDVAIKLLKLFI